MESADILYGVTMEPGGSSRPQRKRSQRQPEAFWRHQLRISALRDARTQKLGNRENQARDMAAVARRARRATPTNQVVISRGSRSKPIDEPMYAYTFCSWDADAAVKKSSLVCSAICADAALVDRHRNRIGRLRHGDLTVVRARTRSSRWGRAPSPPPGCRHHWIDRPSSCRRT